MAEMIHVAIAGWFVAPIIAKVIEQGLLLLRESSSLKKQASEGVQKLCDNLDLVKAVLDDAEKKQYDSNGVRTWLGKLMQILYDAEDLLELHAVDLALKSQRRKRDKFLSIFSRSERFMEKMMKIKERLDDIVDFGHKLGLSALTASSSSYQQVGPTSKLWRNRETTSSLQEKDSTVLGRDEDAKAIMKLLLPRTASGPGDGWNESFGVIPMVGMGGVGKTTLARLVYHDNAVESFFKLRVWVSVGSSTNLHPKQIMVEIINKCRGSLVRLESLDNDSLSRETLKNTVLKEIKKRHPFLLVIDDAWDANRESWNEVLEPLKACAGTGNRVIVTTRDNGVAHCIRDRFETITLGLLSDDHMWTIFKRNAFYPGKDNSGDYARLRSIGLQIVGRLKGLPLAAEIIGSILRENRNERYWMSISDKLVKVKKIEDDFLPILVMSYNCLPSHLKSCFSYFSLFPKDHRFHTDRYSLYNKHDITDHHWMAHKFCQYEDGTTSEDAGTDGFVELANKSLLQIHMDRYGDPFFALHDLIHDLAEFVSKDESVRVGDDPLKQLPMNIRHVSFFQQNFSSKLTSLKLENHKTLRSLIFCSMYIRDDRSSSCLNKWFKNLICLRVLCLHNNYISSLPESIGDLRLLHLLFIQLEKLEKLPETISGLYNLQVLKIHWSNLNALPKSIIKLVNLRYLDVTTGLLKTVNSIGKLTSLVQLKEFYVLEQNGYKISELENLDSLCGSLCIRSLENVEDEKDAQRARLDKKKGLEHLKLDWSSGMNENKQSNVLEGLCPSNNLKSLTICGYKGNHLASWLDAHSLPWLDNIKLLECKNLIDVMYLSALHICEISSCPALVKILFPSHTSTSDFASSSTAPLSSLKKLSITGCPNLDESLNTLVHSSTLLESIDVSSYNNCLEFSPHQTSISKVKLKDCHGSVAFNCSNLVSLRYLYIDNCPHTHIKQDLNHSKKKKKRSQSYQVINKSLDQLVVNQSPLMIASLYKSRVTLTSLTELSISSDSELDDSVFLGFLSGLASLQQLQISTCPKLTSISANKGLRQLKISNCSNITSISATEVETLEIINCPNLTSILPKEALCELVATKGLIISNCDGIMELDFQAFASLERLIIKDCPNLMFKKSPSSFYSSLSTLEVQGFNIRQLTNLIAEVVRSPLRKLQVGRCDELECFEGELESFLSLTSLEELRISKCSKLRHLPADLRGFTQLRQLCIEECMVISALPDDGLPITLEDLVIHDCPELTSRYLHGGRNDYLESMYNDLDISIF